MRSKTTFVLAIIAALAFCLVISQPVMASDEEDVLLVMENWFTAFNTSDSELMSSLYWNSEKTTSFWPGKDGSFLVQGWNKISVGWTFDVPAGTNMNTNHHPQVTLLGKDVAIFTNYNTSVYTDPETKEQTVSQVRGTFVLQKIDGKWLIVHDHSSMLPTE